MARVVYYNKEVLNLNQNDRVSFNLLHVMCFFKCIILFGDSISSLGLLYHYSNLIIFRLVTYVCTIKQNK